MTDNSENAIIFIRSHLLYTLSRRFRCPKTQLFENALQSGTFWKRRFHVLVWKAKTEVFENADVSITQFNKVIPLMVSLLSSLIACLQLKIPLFNLRNIFPDPIGLGHTIEEDSG